MANRNSRGFTGIAKTEGFQPDKPIPPLNETEAEREKRTSKDADFFKIIEADSRAGFSPDSPGTEIIWTGGKDSDLFNLDKMLGHIVRQESLRRIVLAIIDHPEHTLEIPPSEKRKVKDDRTYRLEQAMRYLVGDGPPSGPSSQIPRQDLLKVASLYFESSNGAPGCYPNLRQILIAVRWPDGPPTGLTHKQIDDLTDALETAFLRNKHELLTEVSARGLSDVDEPERLTDEVIRLIARLGFAVDPATGKKGIKAV